jgi:uncharacterized protein YndB with AHSA1/START domain
MNDRNVTHASFTLERRYRQPPHRVYSAFADGDMKAAWFNGPEEWGPDSHSFDFRVGGRETSVGGPKGGTVHSFQAIYQDIVPDQRIVYTYDMELDGKRISVSLATLEFIPAEGGTHLRLTEQGAFLDGWDNPKERERGTLELLDALGRWLDKED